MPPFRDIFLPAAISGFGINRVNLIEREFFKRVLLVYKERQSVGKGHGPVTSPSDGNFKRLIPDLLFEGGFFLLHHLARDESEFGGLLGKHRSGSARSFDGCFYFDIRIILPESFDP